MSADRIGLGLALLLGVLGVAGGGREAFAADPKPIVIQIQVIEATKTSTVFDARLGKVERDAIVGYKGARLLDSITVKVEPKKTMKFDVLKKSNALEVTVLEVQPTQVKLRVVMEAFKFRAETTHRKNKATVVVAHKLDGETGLFLAVRPEF